MQTDPAQTSDTEAGAELVPPRCPSQEEWERMSPERRAALEEELYLAAVTYEEACRARMSEEELAAMAESDAHGAASWDTRSSLRAFYRRAGGSLYIASNLPVYYPGETHFAPDLIAVRDVPLRDRDSYIVLNEGKGVDLAIEIHYRGKRRKDIKDNVTKYARLGIGEYFVADLRRHTITGHHLSSPNARRYTPLLGDRGRYRSQVLGLDLVIEGGQLRFYYGTAVVPLLEELLATAEERAASAQQETAAAREESAALREESAALREESAAAKEESAAAAKRAAAALQAAQGALLAMLKLRGFELTADQRRLVTDCTDVDLLRRWIERAASASLTDVFLDS